MEINTGSLPQLPVASQRSGCNECAPNGFAKQGDKRSGELPEDQRRQVEELKQRDREVRAHESAHIAAAGGHAQGGAKFSYTRGPDGRLYATGGEVSIDTSAVPGDPQATLQKAQTVQRAALAPAEPSGQDRQVAAQAAAMATQARQEMSKASQGSEAGTGTARDSSADLLQRIHTGGAMENRPVDPLHLVA